MGRVQTFVASNLMNFDSECFVEDVLTHFTADEATHAAVGRERAPGPGGAGGRALEHAARIRRWRRIVRRVRDQRRTCQARQAGKNPPLFRTLKVSHSCYRTIVFPWKRSHIEARILDIQPFLEKCPFSLPIGSSSTIPAHSPGANCVSPM